MYINLDELEERIFTDGQPHIKLEAFDEDTVDINCRIRTPNELFKLMMVQEVLVRNGKQSRLHIKYLMGARMDRPIDDWQPATLELVSDMINFYFQGVPVSVFCPHSEAVRLLFHGYKENQQAERNFYYRTIEKFASNKEPFTLILPDAGAGKRWFNDFQPHFSTIFKNIGVDIVECSKKRDMETQKLSSFLVPKDVKPRCLILDDLCDGGRTFIGLAEQLRERGAETVALGVCHGIFSYGYDLKGINKIYTTNSYKEHDRSKVNVYNV